MNSQICLSFYLGQIEEKYIDIGKQLYRQIVKQAVELDILIDLSSIFLSRLDRRKIYRYRQIVIQIDRQLTGNRVGYMNSQIYLSFYLGQIEERYIDIGRQLYRQIDSKIGTRQQRWMSVSCNIIQQPQPVLYAIAILFCRTKPCILIVYRGGRRPPPPPLPITSQKIVNSYYICSILKKELYLQRGAGGGMYNWKISVEGLEGFKGGGSPLLVSYDALAILLTRPGGEVMHLNHDF